MLYPSYLLVHDLGEKSFAKTSDSQLACLKIISRVLQGTMQVKKHPDLLWSS